MEKQGNGVRVLLFTGDGKGKTTAAFGMVLRAVGHGMRCAVIQFMKKNTGAGELKACELLSENVVVEPVGLGFVPSRDSPHFTSHVHAAGEGLKKADTYLSAPENDLVVLDEICGAVAKGLVGVEQVAGLVRSASAGSCVVLTGRNAAQELVELADTVTEMRNVKHGFDEGLSARKGVEM